MTQLPAIECFPTSNGAQIYRFPLVVFPGLVGFSHLILNLAAPILVDTGSGFGENNEHLALGIAALRDQFGVALQLTDIQTILITHGHIDHFGGLAFAVEQTGARVGIHRLDRRVLTNYEERIVVATKDLTVYLERAGVDRARQEEIITMYGFAKKHLRSVKVNFDLDDDSVLPGMRIIHAPGHCPGQVCILIGDVLLSADHVLPHTTPHQAPESLSFHTGLGHYRESLRKIELIDGIRLALGGHEEPMPDIYRCIHAIRIDHDRKLNRVLEIIRQAGHPCAIDEITQTMYPNKIGYDIILALEEVGAHVEYLYQHGELSVANLDEVERESNPALRYRVT